MQFLKDDFLLNTETARGLYGFAAKLPIIDYHCHLSPREIYEDRHFENLTELWLEADHYKWRLMRAAGVEERVITGEGAPFEKFMAWARTLRGAIGNPLLEWSHLELRNAFGFDEFLDEGSAEKLWDLAREKLKDLSARSLIARSRVEVICTTDDPADDLEYHRLMAKDPAMPCRVYPAWRPDKAVDIEKADWNQYIDRLGAASGREIGNFEDLKATLLDRLDHFAQNGCRLSDHGLAFIPFSRMREEEAAEIFEKRRNGQALSSEETEGYKFTLLQFLGRQYHRLGWVMQLHYGVKRDNAERLYRALGPDAGGDSIGDAAPMGKLADFLNALDRDDRLPKTILYSLNPQDNGAIESVMACFQQGPALSKLQHGSAWWFNDNFAGMWDQLTSLASQGYLRGFVGMLTDSRSFLSYARHEYFRRILCRLLGQWVEEGRYPRDEAALKELVEGICYRNAKEYFDF
ncbi:MAG: glucuronate isomerase [Lachnospiraceae bacterium]|nr:glucuronate isomerase [Lachnospiraceae bacterium]